MKQELINQLLPIILTAVGGVISYIGIAIKNKIAEKIDNETKKSLVQTTVKYIEQIYKDLQGQEKLSLALQKAEELFKEHNIQVGTIELEMLIEEVVNNIRTGK